MILNYTPHALNIFANATYDTKIRKYVGGEIVRTIPSSGLLNAKLDRGNTTPDPIDGIPMVNAATYSNVDPLPELGENDYVVVSFIYLSAAKSLGMDTTHILTIGDAHCDSDGKIDGCVNLTINK